MQTKRRLGGRRQSNSFQKAYEKPEPTPSSWNILIFGVTPYRRKSNSLLLLGGRLSLPRCTSVGHAILRCCLLPGVLVFASTTPAVADKDYPTSIINDPASPVTLTKCEAWARDWNKTIEFAHASLPNWLFDLGIAFTNTSDKPVIALRVEMISYDGFNTALRTGEFDTEENRSADNMSVARGASFDLLGPRSWHRYNGVANRDHVSCAIIAVKFADGTVWTAGSSGPSQRATPTPKASTSPPGLGKASPGGNFRAPARVGKGNRP